LYICVQHEIGWRGRSRKMLLYSTDAGFHYAGDGKVRLSVCTHKLLLLGHLREFVNSGKLREFEIYS